MNKHNGARGFTIVEFMIAITLSLLVISALVGSFVSSSRARAELERANQQIESARFAAQLLSDELQVAGYLSHFNITMATLATPVATPAPCATANADLTAALPIHVQGYDRVTQAGVAAAIPCIDSTQVLPGTDIVVVRRVATCVAGTTDCAFVNGAPYFQASLCNSGNQLGSLNPSDWFRLTNVAANLDRTQRDCTTAAERRQFLTRIYFIANRDQAGDTVPTLKRADLGFSGGAVTFTTASLAQGVEDVQIEYGIDTNNDGAPEAYTADPGSFNGCVGVACVENWRNVVAGKIHVLSRNLTLSPGYVDTKTYSLGLLADGNPLSVGPFNDNFKRHAFRTAARFNNPAGRRE